MIRINLLPEEYRKKARTPFKMLIAIGAVVAVNAGLASWWAWTVFGVRAKVESERATLQLEMDGLAPQVAFYHSLETESKQYESRAKTLATITSNRISWTRKLDELIDVANAGGDGSRHLVWLDDLTVAQTTDPTGKHFGSVRASGHSGSEKFAQVANFLEDLETSAFVDDFARPSPPEGTQTLVDETLMPPVAWAFPLSLTLKSPEDRAKASAERLKTSAAAAPTDDPDATDAAGAASDDAASPSTGTDAEAPTRTPEDPAPTPTDPKPGTKPGAPPPGSGTPDPTPPPAPESGTTGDPGTTKEEPPESGGEPKDVKVSGDTEERR